VRRRRSPLERDADEPKRERGRLPHVGIGVGDEREQDRHAFRQPDAADRQGRAPAHSRLVVGHQHREIG
jgi:hypothetical protein